MVTVENNTNKCGVVGTEPDGFVVTVMAIGGTGNGSVKVWPNGRPEPKAGGALAFSVNDRAPAVTLFVEESGFVDDLVVKVLKNSADIKVVVTGYWDEDAIPRYMD